MQIRVILLYALIVTAAIGIETVSAEAQIVIDSGMVRELVLTVKNPALPEWGVNECFQIGDEVFSPGLMEMFYTSLIPRQKRFQYCGVDSQMVARLNGIMDSLSDESWYELKVKYDNPVKVTPLYSGSSNIDSNLSGRCLEYFARYVVINTRSSCGDGGNIFDYFGNLRDRHIILLHVDVSTVHERQFDKWVLGRLIDNKKALETEVFRSK